MLEFCFQQILNSLPGWLGRYGWAQKRPLSSPFMGLSSISSDTNGIYSRMSAMDLRVLTRGPVPCGKGPDLVPGCLLLLVQPVCWVAAPHFPYIETPAANHPRNQNDMMLRVTAPYLTCAPHVGRSSWITHEPHGCVLVYTDLLPIH